MPDQAVSVGSVWRNKKNLLLARVVDISPSSIGLIAVVEYDSGDGQGFSPSILPSYWAVSHWDELFDEVTT